MKLASSSSLLPPLPTVRDLENYLVASLRLQHPEWLTRDGDGPELRSYQRKIHELMGAFDTHALRPNP